MLTAICPVYNEENYIHNVIEFFLKAKPVDKELYIIDGNSSDKTVEIVKKYQETNSNIYLLDNPDKYVPYALNKAIKASKGDPIVRLDAHTKYADDYFEQILDTFNRVDADIVGGPMRAIGDTSFQKAVAFSTSTKMGVGDSSFHFEQEEGYADTVYLGSWKREIFDEVGYFDERMVRNQDDEFHYRAKSFGKKVYLNPRITSYYYPRAEPSKLFKQYYQYGLYKPLVLKKIKSAVKLRHLIPSGFVLYLLSLPLIAISTLWLLPLLIYILLALYFTTKAPFDIKTKLNVFISYPILHIAYGSGFILGLFKR